MYYTVEHNNNDYKIKVTYDNKNKKYVIADILLVSGDVEPTAELAREIENKYPEAVAEMGYADVLVDQLMKGY